MRRRIVAIAACFLAAGTFALLVWPTPYQYDEITAGQARIPFRTHRLTGAAERLGHQGWEPAVRPQRVATPEELTNIRIDGRMAAGGVITGTIYNGTACDLAGTEVVVAAWSKPRTYTVRDPKTGRTVTFRWNGPAPPTDADLDEIFAERGRYNYEGVFDEQKSKDLAEKLKLQGIDLKALLEQEEAQKRLSETGRALRIPTRVSPLSTSTFTLPTGFAEFDATDKWAWTLSISRALLEPSAASAACDASLAKAQSHAAPSLGQRFASRAFWGGLIRVAFWGGLMGAAFGCLEYFYLRRRRRAAAEVVSVTADVGTADAGAAAEAGDNENRGNSRVKSVGITLAAGVLGIALMKGLARLPSAIQQSGNAAGQEEVLTDAELTRVADQISQTLPRMLDKYTQLNSASALPGGQLVYLHTLLNYPDDFGAELTSLVAELRPQVVNHACTMPETRDGLLKRGVVMRYRYFDKHGRFVGEVAVRMSDCQ